MKWQLKTLQSKKRRIANAINSVGADPYAQKMWDKGVALAVEVKDLPVGAANILKQEALASGIDAAVAHGTINAEVATTDAVIVGTIRGFRYLAERLKRQPYSLPALAEELTTIIERKSNDENGNKANSLLISGVELPLDRIHVMGIVNITPDSFSDGGKYTDKSAWTERIRQVIDEGATFVDIGGVSTRPNYTEVSLDDELKRVLPAVETALAIIGNRKDVFVSVDSWRVEVLERALALGAHLINDQSELADERLAELSANTGAALCIMHNSESDVCYRLAERVQKATSLGVNPRSIILDPGFGFVKDVNKNYEVLRYLGELCDLGYPVLAGVSRKSMINAAVNKPVPADRLYGTLAAEVIAAMNGAKIIRTHDVVACVDAMRVVTMAR